jgi:hypothetical protein
VAVAAATNLHRTIITIRRHSHNLSPIRTDLISTSRRDFTRVLGNRLPIIIGTIWDGVDPALKQRQMIFEISLMSADTQHWLRRYLRLSRFYQTFAVETASSFAFMIVASISAGAAIVGSTKMLVTSVTPMNPRIPPRVLLCRS